MSDNFDNYGMKVQATASVKMPSVREINKQIDTLEESIKKLRISGKFDDSALRNLTNQLSSLKATVSTANFSPTALTELTSQVEKALGNIQISAKVGQEVGSAITKGMQQNIDTGVVGSIKKISDSTTSTVVQNEKKKQDAYRATTETVMYHAGVVSKLNKAETNGRFYGSSRGTGYFGTGHYFVDSATKHELDNNSSYSKLPYTSIDISKYDNLFKANTDEIANRLHSFLENLTKFTQGSDANSISELFSQFKKVFGDTVMDMQEFDAKLEQLKSFMQNSNMSDRSDSVSTQFMKSLGYGGVDTRGTRYADTRYGTVIYDLKEESVLQANITDELQKQGQMLEKINYEKGQVFDKTEDSRIQSIIDQQAKSKEIESEFNRLFDSTKLKEYESELDSVNETLKKNDDIISDCQYSINNADEEARKFAKDMANLGLDMSEDEIKSQADDYRVTFQERIDELEKERPLLESRKKQLEENLNAEYELANVAREQARQIVDERHKEVQSIQEVSDRVKSFSELKIKSDDFVNIDGLTKAEDILDKVRSKYEQFGQVTFKNIELDADGNLKSFRVNIQQTNGDLKETRNFLMEISDDAKKVKFADDTIKGTENIVRHLNEQKDATDEIIKEEQKLVNAMADVREKSEKARQAEEKRQELAQNKAINKALEEEYNQKQKIIAQDEKLAQATAKRADKIQLSWQTEGYQSKVDSLIARTNQWVDANGNARISTESLQTALNNLGTAYTNLNSSGGNTVANQQALIEAEKALDTEVKKVQSSITSMNATMAKSSAVDSLRQKYQQFYDLNTASHGKYGKLLLSAISELAPGAEVTTKRVQELNQQLIQTTNICRQTGKLGLSFFDTIKQGMQKFSYWTSSTFIIMKTIQEIKEAVSFAKEMDSALTNINYTMDVTKSQLTDIGNSSIQMAKDLKTSASDILGAVTLYANAKETADSILKKSEAAIMLGNVTGMSGEQSAKALQSVMNQFDMTQDDLMYISDTIQAVSQNMAYNFSSGIEEIVGGIERSGSVAKAAGLDLNEYASMLGLVIEKTGLSGETIGTAYRTILTRITKASKIEGTSDEDISKAETALNAVGVQVRSTAGEFRDMTDIMEDLGKVWNNLNDVQQANISYEIAGTRQTNIIKTLLGYWTEYEDLATKAGDAAGTTLENQSKYEETLDAKTKELSTTMQSFWHNLIGAEEANGVLAIFQKVATALDTISGKLGSLGTIGLGAGVFAGFKNVGIFRTITDDATGATKSISIFNSTIGTMKRNLKSGQGIGYSIFGGNQLRESDVKALNNYVNGIKSGLTPAKSWRENLTGCSVAAKKYVLDAKKAGKSTKDLAIDIKQIPKVSKAGQVALKGLALAGNMLATMAISWAIGELINGINDWIHASEIAIEKSKELSETWKEENTSIDDSISKYKELHDKLKDSTLSNDEIKSTKEELLKVQKDLVDEYGQEALGIDLINGKYDEQIKKIRDVSKEKASAYVAENSNNNKKNIEYLTEVKDFTIGTAVNKDLDFGFDINELLSKFSSLSIKSQSLKGDIYNSLVVTGTREKAYNELSEIFNYLTEKFGRNNPSVNEFKETISSIMTDSFDTEAIKNANENVLTYAQADILDTSDTRKLYDDAQEAVKAYNDAITSGKGIKSAKSNLDEVKKSVEEALGKNGVLSDIYGADKVFQAIWDSISTGASDASNAVGEFHDKIVPTLETYKEASDGISSLATAYKELSDNKYISLEAISKVKEAVGDSISNWDDYEKKLLTVKKGSKDFNKVMGDITYAILENKLGTEGLANADEEYVASLLKSNGVLNSNKVAQEMIAVATAKSKINLDDNTKSIINNVNEMYKSGEASKLVTGELLRLIVTEKIFNNQDLTTAEKIDDLESLAKAFGITAASAETAKEAIKNVDVVRKNVLNGTNSVKDLVAAKKNAESDFKKYTKDILGNIDVQFGNLSDINYGGNNSKSKSSSSSKKTAETFDWVEVKVSRLQRKISNLSDTVSDTFKSWSARNTALGKQISAITELIGIQEKASAKYLKKANSVKLSESYKKKVREGKIDIESIKDEKTKNNIKKYQEYWESYLDSIDSEKELQSQLSEAYRQQFDIIESQYDSKITLIENDIADLENAIDLAEARGKQISGSYYNSIISTEKNNISTLESEYKSLNSQLNSMLKSGKIIKYSEEWYTLQDEIDKVKQSWDEAKISLEEYLQKQKEADWSIFDREQEKIRDIASDNSFILGLLENEDMYDENGKITEFGTTANGLRIANIRLYAQQVENYADELIKLEGEYTDKSNTYYLDRKRTLIEGQQEAINAINDERQALIDLAKEGYDALLSHMQKVIDNRKEMLNSQKD